MPLRSSCPSLQHHEEESFCEQLRTRVPAICISDALLQSPEPGVRLDGLQLTLIFLLSSSISAVGFPRVLSPSTPTRTTSS